MKVYELLYKRELERSVIIRFKGLREPEYNEVWDILSRQGYNVQPDYESYSIMEISEEIPTLDELLNA